MKFKFSLTYKLLAGFLAVVVIVLAVVGVSGSLLIRRYFIADKENELTAKAYELSKVVNSYHDGKITREQLQSFINSVDNFLDARVWVVDNKLKLVNISEKIPAAGYGYGHGHAGGSSPNIQQGRDGRGMMRGVIDYCMSGMGMGMRRSGNRTPQPPQGGASAPARDGQDKITLDLGQESPKPVSLGDIQNMRELNEIITDNRAHSWTKTYYHPYYEENMIIAAVPLTGTNGSRIGTIMLNAPLAKIDEFLNEISYYLSLAGLAGILFAALLAAYLSRGIVRPLKNMQKAAASMALGDYEARVEASSGDEVGELGRSLNSLAKDLGRYVGQMQKTDAMRRDFVANVSHELRTPLTIMRGYNQALEDGTVKDPGEAEKYRRIMGEEIGRLEKLISQLLDLSQLESDSRVLELEEIDLKEIIDNVMSLLQKPAQERGITLAAGIEESVRPLTADGGRLTQLVLILMDNALKFTPPGGTVKIALAREEAGTVLTIADTGAGIAPEELPHIWERFYKTGRSRPKQGAGLGLAIAKQILELHRAQVQVSSQLLAGTTFRILFPGNS